MLVVRGDATPRRDVVPLRNLFEAGDAWLATGDLFARDADGDHWFVNHIGAVIQTDSGPVVPSVLADALETIPQVDLAVAYGLGGVVVAAVQLLRGARISAWDVGHAVRALPREHRPAFVRTADIPLTAWSRPRVLELRDAGIPRTDDGFDAWRLADDGETYLPLT